MGITKQDGLSSTSDRNENVSKCDGENSTLHQNVGLEENSNGQESLQNAFLKFKKSRQKKLKRRQHVKRIKKHERSEEMMYELRMKFVEQANKYLGVPYAKRYHEPGSLEYNAPLFLDCCGLVRRVLRDLRNDFGFYIGPWNQAYMFDTLPIDIENVEDLKPGDLVFVSGIFYKPEMRKQRHNMVHVEIWAGDKEKTIGARWKRGRLQIHDSYKYVSKSYHSMVYHFKSIDTWLKGICKSFCPEHAWKLSKFTPGKRSIFAIKETDENADDCIQQVDDGLEDDHFMRQRGSEDCDEDVDDFGNRLSSDCTTGFGNFGNCSEYDCDESCCCSVEDLSECCQNDWCELNEINQVLATEQTEYSTENIISHPNDGRNSGDQRKSTVSRGKVNRTRKGSSSEKSPDDDQSKNRRPTRPLCRPSASCSKINHKSPTFYIGGHNGAKMVEATLTSLGWERIHDNNDQSFNLKWVECKKNLDYSSFREGEQLVNHISNVNILTTKIGLLTSLQEFERLSCKLEFSKNKSFEIKEFFPETYKLQNQAEIDHFIQQVYQDGEIWICKPTGSNQGKGIFLIRHQSDLEKRYGPKVEARSQRYSQSPGRIVQRYITNPLLLNGFKADIRTYMLIAGTCPYMVFYHPGYVRLSIVPYSLNQEEIHAHLTNQYVQKKHPLYQQVKEETVWGLDKLQEYINETYNKEGILPLDWISTTFTKRMQEIMLKCFECVRHKLERKLGFFDLLGFDFMLDENFKVWLIEINVNPALHTNCQILSDVIPSLVNGTLKLVLEVFEKSRSKVKLTPLENLGNFQLIYNGSKK